MSGIVWTGQVNFTDSSDVATTGVATLTLTPDVGMSNLPVLAAGDPGPPPTFRNVVVNQVPYGTTAPDAIWSLVSAGAAGVASVYDLTLYINSGAPGSAATTTISDATDITGTLTDKYSITYSSDDGLWHVSPVLAGDIVSSTPTSGFTSYSGNAASATLAVINVPAQPFDWRPDVDGFATATGTVNTHVNLIARMGSATAGDQVGYGPGVTGAAPVPIGLHRAYGAAIGGGSSYAKVVAGTSMVFYLVAQQTASTSDAWAVAASSCAFNVKVVPIP